MTGDVDALFPMSAGRWAEKTNALLARQQTIVPESSVIQVVRDEKSITYTEFIDEAEDLCKEAGLLLKTKTPSPLVTQLLLKLRTA